MPVPQRPLSPPPSPGAALCCCSSLSGTWAAGRYRFAKGSLSPGPASPAPPLRACVDTPPPPGPGSRSPSPASPADCAPSESHPAPVTSPLAHPSGPKEAAGQLQVLGLLRLWASPGLLHPHPHPAVENENEEAENEFVSRIAKRKKPQKNLLGAHPRQQLFGCPDFSDPCEPIQIMVVPRAASFLVSERPQSGRL